MTSCVVDDRSVTTGNHSGDECWASDVLGSPGMPPTDDSLRSRLSNLANLNKAWRVVRQSALQSASSKISRLAKEFDQNSIQNLREIERALNEDAFVFKGVYARLLPRPGKNPRPLAVAPIASRIVQRAILDILWSNPKIKKRVNNKNNFDESMEELKNLCLACKIENVGQIKQNSKKVNSTFYMGSGKIDRKSVV